MRKSRKAEKRKVDINDFWGLFQGRRSKEAGMKKEGKNHLLSIHYLLYIYYYYIIILLLKLLLRKVHFLPSENA